MAFNQCLCSDSKASLKSAKKMNIEEMKGKFTDLISEIGKIISDIDVFSSCVDKDVNGMSTTLKTLQKLQEEIRKKMYEIDTKVNDINTMKDGANDAKKSFEQHEKKMKSLKKELEELVSLDETNLRKEAKEQQERAEAMILQALKVKDLSYKVPIFKPGAKMPEDLTGTLEVKTQRFGDSKSTDAHVNIDQTDSVEKAEAEAVEVTETKKVVDLGLEIDGKGVIQVGQDLKN